MSSDGIGPVVFGLVLFVGFFVMLNVVFSGRIVFFPEGRVATVPIERCVEVNDE